MINEAAGWIEDPLVPPVGLQTDYALRLTATAFRQLAIRIATVGPESAFRQRGELMASLRSAYRASDRSEYVPEFPGFERLFHVALEAASAEAHIKWPDHLPQLSGNGNPQARLFLAMEAALRRLDSVRHV